LAVVVPRHPTISNGVVFAPVERRLARKTVVQELRVLTLNKCGISLLTSSRDDLTETDDEGRIMMRQIAGAFAEYEKRRLVRKLPEARQRSGTLGGRKAYAEKNLELVELARKLYRPDPELRPVSLRKMSAGLAERGFVTPSGRPYSASAVASMVAGHYRKLNPGHALRR
jgi:DNA invertase Pin-like site-specific DNA recombinase